MRVRIGVIPDRRNMFHALNTASEASWAEGARRARAQQRQGKQRHLKRLLGHQWHPLSHRPRKAGAGRVRSRHRQGECTPSDIAGSKAATGIAGACRLDGRVQRQQVGLARAR